MAIGINRWRREVDEARERLAGRLALTPLLESPRLQSRLGFAVSLKAENLQITGSFKFRPALNGILAAKDELSDGGVVASSSGNFAAAVAAAASLVETPATIVMLPSSSPYKIERTRGFGARVAFCEDNYAARQELVDRLRDETGAVELHPHSSVDTIAGDATLGDEILAACPDVGSVICPASGGGLLGGCALALRLAGSEAGVYGVQPQGNPALARSLELGRRWTTPEVDTIADGIQAACPGELGFDLARELVEDVVTVTDDEIVDAMRWLAFEEKLTVEPAGAAALAALMSGRLPDLKPPVVVVISGGNVEPKRYLELLA